MPTDFKYDADVDCLYIKVREGAYHHTDDYGEYLNLDYDKDSNLLGVELLYPLYIIRLATSLINETQDVE